MRRAKWLSAGLLAGVMMQYTVACEPYPGGWGGFGYPTVGVVGVAPYPFFGGAVINDYYYEETFFDYGCCGGGWWDGWWW